MIDRCRLVPCSYPDDLKVLHLHFAVRWRAELGCGGCRKPVGVFGPEMGPERIYSAVGRWTVRAHGALRCVRMEVMPAVGDLLAARSAPPGRPRFPRWSEHVVIGHLMVRRKVWMKGQISATAAAGSIG